MLSEPMQIAGVGAVTGYGWGVDAMWEGMLSGKPAATLLSGYGPTRDEQVWLARVSESGGKRSDGPSRSAQAMRAAAREAIVDARAHGWRPSGQVGLLHALVIPEAEEWRKFYVEEDGQRSVRDYLTLMPSTPVSMLMQEFGFNGPAMNVSAMCASGNAGLITAQMWLAAGLVDDVLFIATDLSLTPENVEHFVKLGVAVVDREPLDACRPFQEGSSGFAVGEAAVAFLLSRKTPNAYAQVLGGSMTHDAHHVTSVDPRRIQVDRCVIDAMDRAGVAARDIRYLNAHGPGTAQCDAAESGVADELLAPDTQIYSLKPLAGHCQGAAAAVEIAATVLAYEHGTVPAPPVVAPGNRRLLDGATPLVPGSLTLKTSLGMGGHNSAVVLAPAA